MGEAKDCGQGEKMAKKIKAKKAGTAPKRTAKKIDREMRDTRPWGMYQVLEVTPGWKVKRIEVKPGQRLSYQKHFRRKEHWVVVRGEALVVLDGKEIRLRPGQSVDIPKGAWHRIGNPGREKLAFIEIQQGNYFGEDDIERMDDDYGRS